MSVYEDAIHVAVLMGGPAGEHEVSLSTGACIASHLAGTSELHRLSRLSRTEPTITSKPSPTGYRVQPVCLRKDGSWLVPRGAVGHELPADFEAWFDRVEPRSPLVACQQLVSDGVQVVFNALHGPGGEDGSIQGFLRFAGLPYTGPEGVAAALTIDKVHTKEMLQVHDLPTPDWSVLPPSEPAEGWHDWAVELARRLPTPWIVKPRRLGSSVGIEVFLTVDEFAACAAEVARSAWCPRPGLPGSGFFLEQQLCGRELTCGVLELDDTARALTPIEIRPRNSTWFDYDAKYTPGACEEICPAEIDADVERAVQELVVRVHRQFGCAPLSRTDLFLLADGQLSILEINTLPGMTPTSLIPQSIRAEGQCLRQFFGRLVHHALEREVERESVATT